MSVFNREDWLTVKEAADRALYSVDYFRRVFCDPKAPLLPIRVLQGGRIFVSAAAVEALVAKQYRAPGS